jgi:sn-glycerol 3-phosphate transport system ATP-binding protein
MNDGVVEQIGTPLEVYERPHTTFVAGFIGSPSMNFIPARLDPDGKGVGLPGGESFRLPDKGLPAHGGEEVTLGIRPEHFIVAEKGQGVADLKVDIVEALGADTLVYGYLGTERMAVTVRVPGVMKVASADVLPLTCEPDHLHLFDSRSGTRLGEG